MSPSFGEDWEALNSGPRIAVEREGRIDERFQDMMAWMGALAPQGRKSRKMAVGHFLGPNAILPEPRIPPGHQTALQR
jgi:hypothetical protein